MTEPTVFYYFPELDVTAVDAGHGAYLDVWQGDPRDAIEESAAPFDALNVYDYRAGRRRAVTRELVQELMANLLEVHAQ